MNRVAIFRADFLALSETFIRDQISALRNWQPVSTGFRRLPQGIASLESGFVELPRGNMLSFRARLMLGWRLPRVATALRAMRVALVHAHFGTDATDVWPSVRSAGLPLLVTLHGFDINTRRDWWESGHGGLRRRMYPRRLLQMAADPAVHFIAVSLAIRNQAIEYGIPGDRVNVAHIGVDTMRFRPGGAPLPARRKRILFVGRMVEKKGPLLLVRAFARLRAQIADAELVMIGNGPLLAAARQLADELHVAVEFPGARGRDEIIEHLHEARVFCLPSVTAANGDAEGFGLVLLEAQACGVPVVTSARGGAEEGLIHGVTGHAFPEGDLEQLVERLAAWLVDDDLAATASAAASRFIEERFSLEICTRKLEGIYDCIARADTPTRNG